MRAAQASMTLGCAKHQKGALPMKTYVVDTNVLIQAPYAVQCFEEHLVVQ